MDIGDYFVQRDSRGLYLRKILWEAGDNWSAKVLLAFGPFVNDGKGTYEENHSHYFTKSLMDYWVWI